MDRGEEAKELPETELRLSRDVQDDVITPRPSPVSLRSFINIYQLQNNGEEEEREDRKMKREKRPGTGLSKDEGLSGF